MESNLEYNLYNKELKLSFIEEKYENNTQKQVARLLGNAYNIEKALGKDLSNFSYEEIEEFLKSLNRKTVQSVSGDVSFLRSYIDYAIEKGYVPTRINYLKLFRGSEMLSKYVNKVAMNMVSDNSVMDLGSYITRNELHRIIDFCENAQDGAIFGLLFESAYGVALEELRNLKKTDCNIETGEITLTRKVKNKETQEEEAQTRKIIIKDRHILYVLEDAIDQRVYEKNNGVNEELRAPRFDLADTDYVFRVSGRKGNEPINPVSINNRLKKIAKLYDNPFLNPKNIWISGQIDYAKTLKNELFPNDKIEDLERDFYEIVNSRFGYSERYWYTTKRRIKNYIG